MPPSQSQQTRAITQHKRQRSPKNKPHRKSTKVLQSCYHFSVIIVWLKSIVLLLASLAFLRYILCRYRKSIPNTHQILMIFCWSRGKHSQPPSPAAKKTSPAGSGQIAQQETLPCLPMLRSNGVQSNSHHSNQRIPTIVQDIFPCSWWNLALPN